MASKSPFKDIKNYNPNKHRPDFDEGGFGLDSDHNYGSGNKKKQIYIRDEVFRGGKQPRKSAQHWIDQNPEAYYQLALANNGGRRGPGMPTDDTTSYGNWLNDQVSSLYADFESATGRNPNLTWNKYLAGVIPQLEEQFRSSTADQRGEGAVTTGGAQWLAY